MPQKAHPCAEWCVLSRPWCRSHALCSTIMYMHRHVPQPKIWASLGVPSSPIRHLRKTPLAKGSPLDLPLQHGLTGSILHCWALGLSQESTLWAFRMRKTGKNWELWSTVPPKLYVIQKVDWCGKLCGHWTTTCSEQYLSALRRVSCRLVWIMCLFDPLISRFLWENDP